MTSSIMVDFEQVLVLVEMGFEEGHGQWVLHINS